MTAATRTKFPPAPRTHSARQVQRRAPKQDGTAEPPTASQVLEAIGEPVAIYDPLGTQTYTNDAFGKLAAMLAADGGGRLDTIMAPNAGTIAEVTSTARPVERLRRVPGAKGEKTYKLRFAPAKDAGGTISAIVCTCANVTQHEKYRRKAAIARERFRDLARLVSDWLWECDREFKFTYVSDRVNDILGMHPMELRGRSLFDLGTFVPDAEGDTGAPPTEETRTPFRDRMYSLVDKSGERHMCLIGGLPVFRERDGAFMGFRGTVKDVTAELEARAQERRTYQRLVDAIESISDGFALHDSQDRLVLCNSRIRELYSRMAHLFTPNAIAPDLMRASVEYGYADPGELSPDEWLIERVRRYREGHDGTEFHQVGRWMRITERRTVDDDYVSLHSDITEQKEREQALQTAKEEAEVANRTKSQFLANMSHELRTPLNAIIGFSEVLKDELFGPMKNTRYHQYAGDIFSSAKHLLTIINDILDVSKAEAGKMELLEDIFDLRHTIAGIERLIHARAGEAEVVIVNRVPTDLPALFADEGKIKQILLNLLSNAIKFTEPGGRITIEAGAFGGGECVISVGDTGIGMDADEIDIALTPFGQVDSSLARSYEGTGLGLPLCRALAELHGGRIELASTKGKGTTVRVSLPAERWRTV